MAGEIPGLESSESRLVPPAGFAALPGVLSKAEQLCRQAPRWPAPVGLQSQGSTANSLHPRLKPPCTAHKVPRCNSEFRGVTQRLSWALGGTALFSFPASRWKGSFTRNPACSRGSPSRQTDARSGGARVRTARAFVCTVHGGRTELLRAMCFQIRLLSNLVLCPV
jgi:hypothetical protein